MRVIRKRAVRAVGVAVVLAAWVVGGLLPAAAALAVDTSALRRAVTVDGVRAHQRELQRIADQNDGTRAAGTSGYDRSAEYVFKKLKGAGYAVSYQPFTYQRWEETAPGVLQQVAPTAKTYAAGTDFLTMEYSGTGDVTAAVVPTNDVVIPPGAAESTSNSGCEAADFPDATAGAIALIQRGTCNFSVKALNAQAAGARGAIIFNEGQPGRTDVLSGTLGGPGVTIPVLFASFAVGSELYAASRSGPLTVRVAASTRIVTTTTNNVIAETRGGRDDRVVVVGAHLDSVPEGPGINDNGSGSAVILEIALQMAKLGVKPTNKVRFAFWGAEESGLIGSEYYVSQLTAAQIKSIAVNLNFDMVGSPNFVRFVYDGDGSSTPVAGPNGSAVVESIFLDYFRGQGLPVEPTAFDGRSDYGPFIDVGIPAGGLFTGAEGIKTAAQAATYGGTAGVAYDPCYHQACDDFANNNNTALDQMADATAHAVLTFAMTESAVNGTDKGKAKGQFKDRLAYDGPRARR